MFIQPVLGTCYTSMPSAILDFGENSEKIDKGFHLWSTKFVLAIFYRRDKRNKPSAEDILSPNSLPLTCSSPFFHPKSASRVMVTPSPSLFQESPATSSRIEANAWLDQSPKAKQTNACYTSNYSKHWKMVSIWAFNFLSLVVIFHKLNFLHSRGDEPNVHYLWE